MLKIYYGEMKDVCYGPLWFKYQYKLEWFQDNLVQKMLHDVDQSDYISGGVIDSPVLGPIPPEKLSGGLQTLIMIYEMPEKVFDATSCGANCAKWLLEIGKKQDVTINLRYFMPFEDLGPFEIEIINAGRIVYSADEFALISLDFL
ncbi:DUF4869 domain-containing protein [Ruminococcus sp. 5_1_39BFAA]|uniref:DUF4869 domain-containing protein n=1 Tax=Ruminococcus sp. 5_1_39BFAA TaxID=457412 RepID=UPI00356222DE